MSTSSASLLGSVPAGSTIAITAAIGAAAVVVGKYATSLLYQAGAFLSSTVPLRRLGNTISSVGSGVGTARARPSVFKPTPQERVRSIVTAAQLKDPYAAAPALKTDPKGLTKQAIELAKAAKTPQSVPEAQLEKASAETDLETAYTAQDAQEAANNDILASLPYTDFFCTPTEKDEIQGKLATIRANEQAAASNVQIAEDRLKQATVNLQITKASQGVTLNALTVALNKLSFALQQKAQEFAKIVYSKQSAKATLANLEKDGAPRADKNAIRADIEKLEKQQKEVHDEILKIFEAVTECGKVVAPLCTAPQPLNAPAHEAARQAMLKQAFDNLTSAAGKQKAFVDLTAAKDEAAIAGERVHASTIVPTEFLRKGVNRFRKWRAEKTLEHVKTLELNAQEAATYAAITKDPTKAAAFTTKPTNIQTEFRNLELAKTTLLRRESRLNDDPVLLSSANLRQVKEGHLKERRTIREIEKAAYGLATAKGYAEKIEHGETLREKIAELRASRATTEAARARLELEPQYTTAVQQNVIPATAAAQLTAAREQFTTALTALEKDLPKRTIIKTVVDLTYRAPAPGEPGILSRAWTAFKRAVGTEELPIYQRQILG